MLFCQDKLPLAVVGSNTIIEVNSKRVRGRQYPWGVAEGECLNWLPMLGLCGAKLSVWGHKVTYLLFWGLGD